MTNQRFFGYLFSFFGIFSVDKPEMEMNGIPSSILSHFLHLSDLEISQVGAPMLV
jgi:hypothetical protein